MKVRLAKKQMKKARPYWESQGYKFKRKAKIIRYSLKSLFGSSTKCGQTTALLMWTAEHKITSLSEWNQREKEKAEPSALLFPCLHVLVSRLQPV